MPLLDDVARRTSSRPAAHGRVVLRAFGPLAKALHDGADPEDVLRLASAEMAALVGVPRCLVYLRNDRADTFRGVVAHGAQEQRVRCLVSGLAADGLTQEILHTRAAVIVENALSDPRTVRSTMRVWDVHSVLGLPILDRGRILGLFFLDVPGKPHHFDDEARERAEAFAELTSVAFVQAQMSAEARAGQRRAHSQASTLTRILAVDDRLWNAVLDGSGERQLAQVLADLTARSWAVYTSDLERVAAAAPGSGEHDAPPVPDLAGLGVLTHPGVTAVLDDADGRAATVGPLRELGPHRRLLCAASGRGQGRRLVVAVEHNRRFGAVDSMVARRAATVFATQALERDRTVSFSHRARAAELTALLRGDFDAATISRFHTALDLPVDARTMVCVLAGPPGVVDPERVEVALRGALAECSPIVTTVPAGTVALLEAPVETEGFLARIGAVCRELAGEEQLHAGISGAADGLEACPQAYEDALDVLACIAALGGGTGKGATVLAAEDLGCARTLLASAGRDSAERFVRRTLGALLEPSCRHLLVTLTQMADHAWNIRAVAEALGKHENTIRYRIGRIEEVSGLAIRTDARAQMEARMALLVMDVQRRVGATE